MQNNLKILFIPSWYPDKSENSGYYFVELFELYKTYFPEAALLYVNLNFAARNSLKRLLLFKFKFLFNLFLFNYKNKLNKLNKVEDKIILQIDSPFQQQDYESNYAFQFYCYQQIYRKFFNDYNNISAQSVQFAGVVAYHLKKYSNTNIQYTITEHNYFSQKRFTDSLWASVKSAYLTSKNNYFCSHDKMRQVLAAGITLQNSKCIVNYNFVKNNNNIIASYNPGEELKIITVASSSHFKDLDTIFDILLVLHSKGINYKFTLVGFDSWGNVDKYLPKNKIDKLRYKIKLIPYLQHQELLLEYGLNNVFLLTSIAEGMPISLLEAMQIGLIPVVTRHGGSEEVVIDGVHGFVRNIRDVDSLANSLEKIYYGRFIHVPEINKRRARFFCSQDNYIMRTFENTKS